ncbi:hypothetical protein N9M66_01510 [Litoreibacter sp.]|nr:hypothetical protein [Litoreibacter sp.]
MISRLFGAVVRAFFVMLLLMTPALLLPGLTADTKQVVALVALFGALITLIEYGSTYPSLIEFRNAPPFNRIRFVSLFLTVFLLSVLFRGQYDATTLTRVVSAIGLLIGHVIDFPYSPVRLIILLLPDPGNEQHVNLMRAAAGLSYLISLTTLAIFMIALRLGGWPNKTEPFNFWTNLPTFDPTMGGDIVARLTRDARVNIMLGFFLPFFMPAVARAASGLFDASMVSTPQTLVWMLAIWTFLPASLFMRGIAMNRIADMIDDKRQRGARAIQAGLLAV